MDHRNTVSRIAIAGGTMLVSLGSVLTFLPHVDQAGAHTVIILGVVIGCAGWNGRAAVTIDDAWRMGYEAGVRHASRACGQVVGFDRRSRRDRRRSARADAELTS